ncbi:MAG: hypothetical protein AMXMBFR36_08010 [Acidobacteriota bacterium]
MKSWIQKAMSVALVAASFAGAAAASTVKFDYDRTADFSTYESWAWKRGDERGGSSLAEARIRRALAEGLAERGFERVEAVAQADFLVDYRAAAHGELRLREGFRTPGFGRDLSVDRVPIGTLVVDIFDASSRELVWRGVISDVLARDPEKAEKKTVRSVGKLFGKFPPPPSR